MIDDGAKVWRAHAPMDKAHPSTHMRGYAKRDQDSEDQSESTS